MVMTNLPENLWKANPLESFKNGSTMKTEVDHVYGTLSKLEHIVQTDLPEAQGKNWKLMLDPFLKAKGQGHAKVIRYGGRLEGPDELPAVIKDPRFPVNRHKDIIFKMPKFMYDKWSVGTPPMKSIFIYGLNDNVNQEFLTGLFETLGQIDQLKVYYHPKTRKHLGIAFVSFSSPSVTKEVLAKWHGTSIMGNIVNIKPDPLCQITKKVLDKLIRGPVANIPEIIQSVEVRSQHKTAAFAFRHNERSESYYTARGKVRRGSETEQPGQSDKDRVEEERVEELELEQVSPKIDTPPDTEISPIRPEEDMLVEEQFRIKSEQGNPVKHEMPHTPPDPEPPHTPPPNTDAQDPPTSVPEYKAPKPEMLSPSDRHEESRRDARLYEMDRERRKAHSERKYEEWKMKNEMQIRADKTNRYVKEHCGGGRTADKYPECSEKYLADKHSKDKYSKEYRHMSERERYYAYYKDKYHRSSDRRYLDEKHRPKYEKYKYELDKYKYYGYHRHSHQKPRSSSQDLEKIHKPSKPGSKDYEKYENVYHRESPRPDGVLSPIKREVTPDPHLRLREADHLVERASKRKRSKSPLYQNSPLPDPKILSPKPKEENSGSAASHDTGYNSISPVPVSPAPPKPEPDISLLSENPYGCGRAVPRKDITKVKLIGLKSEGHGHDYMSSSSMSLDEESVKGEEEMRVEDISPNTTPQQPIALLPTPTSMPLLPLPTVVQHVLQPPAVPLHYQTGQWLHTTYPEMYQYESEYDPEEAAAILAQREAEESAAAKREELQLNKERKSLSLDMLLHLMETVLNKDIKITLSEKVAFTQLEDVWNQEEDRKKKEEEDLAARKREEMANSIDQPPNKAPDMPSLSEMRSLSDAKQSSHIRQANLSFKVPKLNRGLRAQVIVKKMPLPQKQDSAAEEHSEEEEVDETQLVTKRRQVGNRYNKIYSSSSSSSSESEGEAGEDVAVEKTETLQIYSEVLPTPVAAAKYSARCEEEEILVLEQLFRDDVTEEDKVLFKTSYDLLLKELPELLAGVTWLSPPEIPHSLRRRQPSSDVKHRTGCARTEGYYRMSKQEKIELKQSFKTSKPLTDPVTEVAAVPPKKLGSKSSARSTRALQRRQATHFLDVPLVQFMQLTTRWKQVKFQRSDIHDWGLFSQEAISADEMVIEYVGEVVREIIANIRERQYEKEGIGSSYLFRIDQSSYIVDATHKGSISRFINHNCDPNCYARVINVGLKKKIVIYSKRDIEANEEITYDYKFAIEEEANKIPCLCKSPACRGFLN